MFCYYINHLETNKFSVMENQRRLDTIPIFGLIKMSCFFFISVRNIQCTTSNFKKNQIDHVIKMET